MTLVNTDFTYQMVLKNVKHIDDHFNSAVKKALRIYTQTFFLFIFSLQKMENNNDEIISKKLRIMTLVK